MWRTGLHRSHDGEVIMKTIITALTLGPHCGAGVRYRQPTATLPANRSSANHGRTDHPIRTTDTKAKRAADQWQYRACMAEHGRRIAQTDDGQSASRTGAREDTWPRRLTAWNGEDEGAT